MKIMRYILGAVMTLAVVGCEPVDDDNKSYPELQSLVGTLWYSYDEANNIFYDITYAESTGSMIGYDSEERVNEVVNRPFDYTFTPATPELNGVVRINFHDGKLYGGPLVPKGYYQINLIDVYLIQLYEVDEQGEILYTNDGQYLSTITMWMEGEEEDK